MFSPAEERSMERLRRKTVKTLADPKKKQAARAAAHAAAQQALLEARVSQSTRTQSSSSTTSDNNNKNNSQEGGGSDVWMCGVCGRAFTSFAVAEKHETDHVHKVVTGMGYAVPHVPHDSQGPVSGVQTPRNAQEVMRRRIRAASSSSSSSTTQSKIATKSVLRESKRGGKSALASSSSSLMLPPIHERQDTPSNNSLDDDEPQNEVTFVSAVADSNHNWRNIHGFDFDDTNVSEDVIIDDDDDDDDDDDKEESQFASARKTSFDAAGLPPDALVPKPRSEVRFDASLRVLSPQKSTRSTGSGGSGGAGTGGGLLRGGGGGVLSEWTEHQQEWQDPLLVSESMKESVLLPADQALLQVCQRAESMILTKEEKEAERTLALLARDKEYYDEIARRAASRRSNPTSRYRTDGQSLRGKVQNKFLDAYQLVKEGKHKGGVKDQYTKKTKNDASGAVIVHSDKTLYVNVMVKNSVQVVRHELERLASKRWETTTAMDTQHFTRFERFRVYAHVNIVKLAGIALASDFTPRRIAVQLSNDLYRLLTPRLKRRGVTIECEIEYRVGPYFVLGVNISAIDWRRLIRAIHRDVALRKARWQRNQAEHDNDGDDVGDESPPIIKSMLQRGVDRVMGLWKMSGYEYLEQFFVLMYYLHWIISHTICILAYGTVLGPAIRRLILSSVTDEIFFYVEEKGMEMEIQVRPAKTQAAFMLSALREIRADGQELEKKKKETESQEQGQILGPLLGPAIKEDSEPAVPPPDFVLPENLEFIGLEVDLPVGFRRLRWAWLSGDSSFITEALYKVEARYENIEVGEWDKHKEHIGNPNLPPSVNPEDFIGAVKEGQYLMPKSAFVSANMSYETHYLIAYNDYCFAVKKRAKNPDVPFGKSFVAWTQYIFVNTGDDSCKLTCSVEAEFPNGEPMVARQIRSGMRAGTGDLFVLTGETIIKYAYEFP